MIQHIDDLNLFNGPIINLFRYTKLIIKVLFPDIFCQYLIDIKNKMIQLLEKLKYELEYFFEKAYKIRAIAVIPGLSRLIYNNLSLNLT